MAISDTTKNALEELGLTKYEIKVYLTLIEFGPTMASNISDNSNVPYSKIYDVLGNLEKKGWVEVEHTRPSKFFAKPPKSAIDTMRMKADIERSKNEKQVLLDLSDSYGSVGSSERPEIWIVRGEYNILNKVEETLQTCEKELMVAFPSGITESLELFSAKLIELRDKRVEITLMTESDITDKFRKLCIGAGIKVGVREAMFSGGLISDSKQVIIFLSPEAGEGSSLAIWADHVGLASFAKDYFEYLWKESRKTVS